MIALLNADSGAFIMLHHGLCIDTHTLTNFASRHHRLPDHDYSPNI